MTRSLPDYSVVGDGVKDALYLNLQLTVLVGPVGELQIWEKNAAKKEERLVEAIPPGQWKGARLRQHPGMRGE